MKIKVIVPITGLTKEDINARYEYLRKYAKESTKIDFVVVKNGPKAIETMYDEIIAGPNILEEIKRIREEECDALIIWCAGDPALEAARELTRVPVIGPGESSILLASMLAYKFSVITPSESSKKLSEKVVKKLGFEPRLVSIKSINMSVLGLKNREVVLQKIIEKSKEAIKEGARAIVLGCLGMWGLFENVQKILNVPVIDPAVAALKMAELLYDMHLFFNTDSVQIR
ncbi:MAG: AroM family protein [Ignisphaera sp.]